MFSVIIPTYNRPYQLKRCLSSLTKQSYNDFEVIVVNDGSDSRYNAIYRMVYDEFNAKLSIKSCVLEKNYGAPYCRNYGALKASYGFLCFLDDDDEWLADKLKFQKQIIDNYKGDVAIYTNGYINYVDQTDNFFSRTYDLKNLYRQNYVLASSVCLSSNLFHSVKGFRNKMKSCQDWDLWIRSFPQADKVILLKENLVIINKSDVSIGTSPKSLYGYIQFYIYNYRGFMLLGLGFHWLRRITSSVLKYYFFRL